MDDSSDSNLAEYCLKCSVCMFCFDESNRRPQVGLCGHSVCSICINRCSRCPICNCDIFFYGHTQIINYQLIDQITSLRSMIDDHSRKVNEYDVRMKEMQTICNSLSKQLKIEQQLTTDIMKSSQCSECKFPCSFEKARICMECCIEKNYIKNTYGNPHHIVSYSEVEKELLCGSCVLEGVHEKHYTENYFRMKMKQQSESTFLQLIHFENLFGDEWNSLCEEAKMMHLFIHTTLIKLVKKNSKSTTWSSYQEQESRIYHLMNEISKLKNKMANDLRSSFKKMENIIKEDYVSVAEPVLDAFITFKEQISKGPSRDSSRTGLRSKSCESDARKTSDTQTSRLEDQLFWLTAGSAGANHPNPRKPHLASMSYDSAPYVQIVENGLQETQRRIQAEMESKRVAWEAKERIISSFDRRSRSDIRTNGSRRCRSSGSHLRRGSYWDREQNAKSKQLLQKEEEEARKERLASVNAEAANNIEVANEQQQEVEDGGEAMRTENEPTEEMNDESSTMEEGQEEEEMIHRQSIGSRSDEEEIERNNTPTMWKRQEVRIVRKKSVSLGEGTTVDIPSETVELPMEISAEDVEEPQETKTVSVTETLILQELPTDPHIEEIDGREVMVVHVMHTRQPAIIGLTRF